MKLLSKGLRMAWAGALVFATSPAWADRVVVLRFDEAGPKVSGLPEQARASTLAAVAKAGHVLPTESEVLTAQMAVGDESADTSKELRAAGRASSADWTLVGHVRGGEEGTYRLELEACLVASGRVESVARDLAPSVALEQVSEMLTYLLRPQGLAGVDIAWRVNAPPATPPPSAPPPVTDTRATAPPVPPTKRGVYADEHPWAVGASLDVLRTVAYPSGVTGATTGVLLGLEGAYALPPVSGLELRARFAGALVGPAAVVVDGGARYMVPFAAEGAFLRPSLGPEASLGGFFAGGASTDPRFLLRAGAAVALGLGARVQVEAVPSVSLAAGGAGTLGFAGAAFRGLVRF